MSPQELFGSLLNMKTLIRLLIRLVRDWLGTVPNPGPLSISIRKEFLNMLQFRVNLPQGDNLTDVVSGELTVTKTLNGETSTNTIQTALGQSSVEGLVGDDNTDVVLSFAYVDNAGNRSTLPAVLTVTLTDTIPPADPGALAVEITGEE